jgi:hypothetical protein
MVLEDEEFVLVEDDMYDIYGEKVFDLYDFLPGDDISIITGLTADEYEEFITEDVKMKKLYKVELVRDLGFEVKTIHVWMDEDTNPDSDTFQTYINEEYEQGNITEDWEPVYIDIHEKDSIRIRDVNEVSDDERDDCIDVLGDSIPE